MLQEQDRQKLDSIVQQMAANKETDESIQAVVNDFKSKYEKAPGPVINTQLPSRNMVQKTAGFLGVEKAGQGIATASRVASGSINQTGKEESQLVTDTYRLIQAAREHPVGSPERTRILAQIKQINGGGAVTQAEIDPGTTLSNKEVLGSFGNVALNVAAPGAFKGGKAAVLAKNAALGGAFGLTGGLNENKNDPTGSIVLGAGIGAVLGLGGQALDRLLPSISKKLEQVNLRLTPTQKRELSAKLPEVTRYLSEKKVIGTPETRFNKIDNIYDQMEERYQTFLTKEARKTNLKGESKPISINKQLLIADLEKLKKQFRNDADVLAIEKQIDRMKTTLKTKYGYVIPLDRLNELKRSIYKNAYNTAGTKVRDDVEFAIGDLFKSQIEKSTKGLKISGKVVEEFNKEYGTVIQARKLLKIAQSRPELGLVGKLVSSAVGASIGSMFGPGIGTAIGAAAGPKAGEIIAGTAPRSFVGAGLKKTSELAKTKVGQITRAATKRVFMNSP